MPSASLLVNLLSALFITFVFGGTEIRFAGQTKFVVNETSTTVIRLVIERIGEPANVTAIVSVEGGPNPPEEDLSPVQGNITFPPGRATVVYNLTVLDDEEGDSVELHITRSRGALVKQFLHYRIEPRDSNEFYGNTGVLEFKPGEREILDEHYWVVLSSHGERESKLGSATVVNITILKNDDPHGIIEFVSDDLIVMINESKGDDTYSEPHVVRVQEGETANFTVLRNGSVDVACTVQYATMDGKATARDGDFVPIEKGEALVFAVGSRKQRISVFINEDDIPETDEPFYIILFNSTGPGTLRIGAGSNGNDRFTGLMQDVRSYERKLTLEEIYELHAMPAKSDLHPVSGYLEFRQGETNKSFIISARDDNEEEGEELFILKLVSVCGGARISEENTTARLIIQKSDNANGLFGFTGACIPEIADEGSTISCVVERTRGALDYVHVFYTISQIESDSINYLVDDFANVLNIYVLDDDIPELNEYFRVTLVSAVPGDGKLGSTPTSGASIDPEKETTDITIKASDHPYGLLQFSTGLPPQPEDTMTLPASSIPHVTVKEEDGEVRLLVVRAQGHLGRVLAEFRTVPLTAFSPEDYQIMRSHGALSQVTLLWSIASDPDGDLAFTSGNVTFEIGQKSANITVEILPDEDPELDKAFSVSILSVSSGSLGVHTNATLTVLASDDPCGVFIFSEKNRPIKVEEATQNITLSVIRLKGLMGKVLVTYATLDDMEKPPYFPPSVARATQGRDYIPASGFALFRANQSEATITISILDDDEPERSESVFIELLNSTLIEKVQNRPISNSPRLGPKVETIAHLIIIANDDAFGTLQLSAPIVRVAENHVGPIINVTRAGGSFADVSVKFKAVPITAVAGEDYSIASSDVVLLEGETSKSVPIYIINDIYPELEESFLVQLLNETTGGARLGALTEAIIIIEASDDPYGLFGFQITKLIVEEPEFNSVKVNLPVIRNSGTLGNVTVQWVATINGQLATGDLRVVSGNVTFAPGETIQTLLLEVLADDVPEIEEVIQVQLTDASGGGTIGLDRVANIVIPANDNPYGTVAFVQSVYRVQEPLERSSCANITVRRSASEGPQCFWMTSWISPVANNSDSWTYRKNMTRVASLFSGQAVAESDYEPVTRQWAIMLEGDEFANLTVSILPDDFPEMDESFLISLLEVHLMNITASFKNQPTIGQPNTSTVVIALNGDAFGVFVIYSISPNTSEDGLYVEVQEQPQTTVELMIHRTGGSLGQVAVEWRVVGGTATEGLDFIGAGDILTFAEGETKKTAILAILDDSEPEDDESIIVSLVYTEGGSRILPSSDTVRVNILANDNVAGIVSFQTASRSVIGHEDLEGLTAQIIIDANDGARGIIEWQHSMFEVNETEGSLTLVAQRSKGTLGRVFLFVYAQNLEAQLGLDYSFTPMVFRWSGGSFMLHQTLPVRGVQSIALFTRGGSVFLAISQINARPNSLLFRWSGSEFINFQEVPINGTTQVEALTSGDDIYLIFAKTVFLGNQNSIDIFIWETGQPSFRYFQSLDFATVNRIYSFTPASGIVHILFIGQATSALYCWNSELNQFSFILEAPSAHDAASVTVKSFNSSKSLIALVGAVHSHIYELAFISSQSDFIPSSGELIFEPGDREAVIAVNILDETIPEEEESFKVQLKNPKGGAEIGINSYVKITILSNDDAYGVVGFAQNSLYKQVEEMEQDSLVTLNVERLKGTYGRITIVWKADGSISDIFPTSGVVCNLENYRRVTFKLWLLLMHGTKPCLMDEVFEFDHISFSEGQALSTITLTVLADDVPELSEIVSITLIRITTEGVEEPSKGATIDEKRNKSVITTLPNDSPHGLVGWHSEFLFVRVVEPKENITILQLPIVRNKGLFGAIAIHLIAKPNFLLHIDNQATENEDYVLQETIIIMKENIRETYIKVAILPDNAPELEEGFIVNITDVYLVNSDFSAGQPSVRRPGIEIVEIMIEENDDPRGIFKFHVTRDIGGVITAYEVPPPLNVLQVPVVRLAGSFGAVNVYWKATVDTAGLEDFKPSHGILEFADKQATAMIEITIIDDAELELMETFNISLIRVAGGGRLGDDVVLTVIIPQNDSPFGVFGFEEKTVMVDESLLSDDPDSYVTLTVVRSPGGKGAVQLQWTIDETAKDDLRPLNGTLLFEETESQKTIVLHTLHDTVLEEDRHFTIQLISIDEVEISPMKAIWGEVMVSWRIFPPSVGEFAEISGKLTMQDGQSAAVVIIQALNDDIPEEKSSYEFQLTGISEGGALSGPSSTANITLVASDFPYGQFSFSQEQLRVSEEAQRVDITVIRSGGSFGPVRLWYETVSGTAEAGLDFIPAAGELLFEAGEMAKRVHIEIFDDGLPEGPEEFSLVITKVELLGRGYDFTIRENGLQLDQPPEIGNISIVRIVIMKNDNADGVIEFDPRYTAFEVEEDVGMIMIPVVRLHGTYGRVTADFISQSSSAVPGGVDYMLHGSSVTFQHGQNLSFINVSIIDDSESEFAEPIEILLVGATGGAVLGRHLVSRITIAKSDSPFGVVRFLNRSKISVPNPNSTMILSLLLERTGGFLGEIQEALPPQNRDIADPVSGSFCFGEGEGGVRTITLTVYPHEDIEVEEIFIIKLELVKGEAKLDSRAKDIILTIQKFGDPNGVVQFAPESLSEKTYSEPLALEGPLIITFFVKRVKGIFGEIMVYWEISSEFDITGDFLSTKGFFTIADGESEVSFDIHLLPDDIPETEEDYVIQLVSVEGGAELDPEKCITRFSVSANDDPHGVFALYSDYQSLFIGQNLSRFIQINVTRLAGTFGDVAVGFRISSDQKERPVFTENVERQLVVKDGARYKVDMVPVRSQVFLSLGSNFTLQLVTAMLVSGRFYGMPKILQEAKSVILPVPEKAANSQVGFESTSFPLMDVAAGTSQVVISRRGTYGSLMVAWGAGYAPGIEIPEFIVVGNMTPKLGSLSFSHGEQKKGVLLWTFASPGRPEAFVLHLSGVQSSAPGGAQLRSGFTFAEIEPMGVFQFSPSSRNVMVSEDTQMIRLYVQRLFGFHGDLVKVSYQTAAGSAKPVEDFEPVKNGELLFQKFQPEVDFEIIIINDQLPEEEEIFYINLTSVEMKGLQKFDAHWRPRLNLGFSVALITILDNDDPAGMDVSFPKTTVAVAVDTALIPVETDFLATYPDTTKIMAVPQPTKMVDITEVTGASAIPEKLVTVPDTSALSETPDVATVTADVSVHGIFSLGPPTVYVEEEVGNGTFNAAEILIRRTGGSTGNVTITVKTFGERSAQKEQNALPFHDIYGISNLTWATEEEDFEEQTLILTFVDGERERKVLVQILDDDEPEGQEFFYVFLTDPQGGAQLVKGKDDSGFAAFASIIITGSDLHNGIVGFSEESQSGLELGEGADKSRLHLTVTRQPNRAFEDVKVFWRVTLNKTAATLKKDGVNLMDELLSVSGTTTCTVGQTKCMITIELKPGKTPHTEMPFFVELYEVSAGAAINNSARFAPITFLQTDAPHSLVYFSVGSRLPVAHKKATFISLQVARDSGTGLMMSVNFSTQELRSAETVGRTLISPALSGKDFVRTEGTLVFEPGQRNTILDVILTPETGSLNPFPKRFQIVLFDPKGGARIDQMYGTANITLVSDADSQSFWGLADQLQRPLDGDILNRVLHSISMKVATESTDEQLSAVMDLLDKITVEGKSPAFSIENRNLFYEILCALINPKRKDTRGFSHFTEVTENFAFSLLTDVTCGSPGEKSKTILDSCPYLSILALHWYPQQINGHKFEGKEGDYIRVPERLLEVPDAEIMAGKSTCELVQFTEYSSQQWFITGNNLHALKNKVLSLSVKGQSSQPLTDNNEVLYRIYAAEPRIIPQTSLCLLWNQAAASWLSDSQFCKVAEDTSDYVECACSYMSVYAVYAQTNNLSSYNEALFSSGFICVSGFEGQGYSRCFIPNIYAALFTAALVPLMCLVVVFVVFIHAYQVKPQWKAYDDVFRGRTNAAAFSFRVQINSVKSKGKRETGKEL
ncbi:hypothetical protein GH733_009869, partial [Mirounga leonina]